MRRSRKHAAAKENNERWLITYSDLITLLLIFFIIMYALSNVDAAKFMTLSESLNAALDPSNQIPLQGLGKTALLADQNPTQGKNSGGYTVKSLSKQQFLQVKQLIKEDQAFSNLYQRLHSYVSSHGLTNSVSIQNQERGVQITLRDVVFFQTGQDVLRPAARQVLQDLIPFLSSVPNDIVVEGYTDNVPIDTAQFPSNWELSAGRAVNVVRFLAAFGISPSRLAATGYGQYHPVEPNTDAANRQENRRVNIVILKSWVSSISQFGGQPTGIANDSLAAIRQSLAPNPHTVLSHNIQTQQGSPLPNFLSGTKSGSAKKQ